MEFRLLLVAILPWLVSGYKDPHYWSNHSTMVHLFEWKWEDIAAECERFLGPKGFGGIQISPPNENVVLWSANRPWWERYQPMSYELGTRSGDEQQFADMVRRCNDVGVRIYADVMINHMSADNGAEDAGTAGSTAQYATWVYPAVPYDASHFNWPLCGITDDDYRTNATAVRQCELFGLKDLNQADEHVRNMLVGFLNRLIDYGVAGFRIDAAKHMWPEDLQVIYDRLNDLPTSHGFATSSRPYVYQEVIDFGGEAISRDEYTPLGIVSEFKVGSELSRAFTGGNNLRWLVNWGPEWGLLESEDALVFIDNHDNQRGHGSASDNLMYKYPKPYKAAIAFMLAHPHGQPQLMSSFEFDDSEIGPPMDNNGNIISPSINADGSCGSGWVCEHRWRPVYQMVGFRNVAGDAAVTSWWDNGINQIAFCRGDRAFIAFNIDSWNLHQNLPVCVPAGIYCDIISGEVVDGSCTGRTVVVDERNRAEIVLTPDDEEHMLAIHVGPESRLASAANRASLHFLTLTLISLTCLVFSK